MPFPLIALAILGGISAIGKGVQAYEQKKQAERMTAEERRRQRISQDLARDAYERGQFQAGIVKLKTSRDMDHTYANAAAGGADPSVGSAQAIMAGTEQAGVLNINLIKANAAREAWGHEDEARQHGKRADDIRHAGQKQLIGNILGIASDVVGTAYGLKEQGLFGSKGVTASPEPSMVGGDAYSPPSSGQAASFSQLNKNRDYSRRMQGAGDFSLDQAFGVA